MVKHIILWKIKDSLNPEEKEKAKNDVKRELEGLYGKIKGLVSIKVILDRLPSSNADMMLDSLFTDENALKNYQVNEHHIHVANTYVRPVTETRLCMDYKEN